MIPNHTIIAIFTIQSAVGGILLRLLRVRSLHFPPPLPKTQLPDRASSSSSAASHSPGMDLSDVVAELESFSPAGLAEDWDNVGLLVEPWSHAERLRKVQAVLLTNDLTPPVYAEARALGVDLVISYHPPLFRSMKRVAGYAGDWQQRLLARSLADGIAIYSPHTSWDARPEGLNDWLLGAFEGRLQARPVPVTPMKAALAAAMPGAGAGRWAPLAGPLVQADAVAAVKSHLGLSTVQVATPHGTGPSPPFTRGVAVCAGSGASVLRDIGDRCDLLVTGEMPHHDLLWHVGQGRAVILTGHSNCERPYLLVVRDLLAQSMPHVTFSLSETDRDPLEVV